MMSRRGTSRRRFMPYRYAKDALRLRLLTWRVDGAEGRGRVDRRGQTLHLEDLPWEEAALELEISGDMALRQVVPNADTADLEVWLVLRCPATRLRKGQPAQQAKKKWRSTVRVRREDLRGGVTVTPLAIRTSRGTDHRYAVQPGARVADGASWTVRLDEPPLPREGYLRIIFKRFSKDQALEHRRQGLYHLEAATDEPLLILNADHKHVAEMLNARGHTGAAARLREVVFDQIARGVWMQLVLKSVEDLATSGDVLWPWQGSVLDRWLPRVYPEVPAAVVQRRAVEDWESGHVSTLVRGLDAALQTQDQVGRKLEKLVGEVMR